MIEGQPKQHLPGRRCFIGFKQTDVEAIGRYTQATTVNITPPVTTFSGVVLVPLKRHVKDWFEGGAYTPRGYVDELRLERGGSFFWHDGHRNCPPPPTDEIEEAWYGGPLVKHYGHFLLESQARLLDRRIIESTLPIVFLSMHQFDVLPQPTKWMLELFSYLGIEEHRVKICHEPTRVRRLLAVPPYIVPRTRINVASREALIANAPGAAPDRGIVYFSRSKVRSRRTFHGEELVEAVVRKLGGDVIHPERLSVSEQIAVVNGARVIVGVEGSALHNVIFARSAKRLIVLCSGLPTKTFCMVDELFDGDTVYINGAPEAGGGNRREWWASPCLLNRLEIILEGK